MCDPYCSKIIHLRFFFFVVGYLDVRLRLAFAVLGTLRSFLAAVLRVNDGEEGKGGNLKELYMYGIVEFVLDSFILLLLLESILILLLIWYAVIFVNRGRKENHHIVQKILPMYMLS